MPAELHETSLIALLAIGFVLALLFGLVASILKVSPIVGYLIAGICVGPFTPGFVADSGLANQLAEIGVILLMFGVGLHFSIKDLMSVRYIALPGAVAQIVTATAIGAGMAHLLGWSFGTGLVFGLSLSVASTVVLLRALEERNALQSSEGKIAVGWLIVEDLAMVLALVMLPALADTLGGDASAVDAHAGSENTWLALAITLAKVAVFVVLALVVGTRVVPWLLKRVTRTGSRELFTLCVLAIALGIAYGSAALFGVSFALGAFFAGVILSESELAHQAGNDSLPLKDAFAVLFFVSVGMLFDPTVLVREPLAVLVGAGHHHGGQVAGRVRHRAGVPPSGAHRADGVREPGADRRVLVHSREPRRGARAAAARRARSDPRRRAAVHRAESHHLRGHRAAHALARGAPQTTARCSNGAARTNIATRSAAPRACAITPSSWATDAWAAPSDRCSRNRDCRSPSSSAIT